MLLEKVAQLNKKDSSQTSEVSLSCRHAPFRKQLPAPSLLALQDGSAHDTFDTSLTFEEVDIDNVNQLMVSVQGKRYSITPHEVSQMSLQSFSALWTVSTDNDPIIISLPRDCYHTAVQQSDEMLCAFAYILYKKVNGSSAPWSIHLFLTVFRCQGRFHSCTWSTQNYDSCLCCIWPCTGTFTALALPGIHLSNTLSPWEMPTRYQHQVIAQSVRSRAQVCTTGRCL